MLIQAFDIGHSLSILILPGVSPPWDVGGAP